VESIATSRPVIRWQWLSWPLLLGCLATGYACIEARYLFLDADTLWHLRTGEWIWQQRRVPDVDIFSHTVSGQPWIAHEWLAALIFFGLFASLSWVGPAALTALAFGAAVGWMAQYLFARLEPARALLLTMLVFASLATHLLARPHILAMPILVYWVIQLADAVEEQRRPSLWLSAIMLLWANLHGSFIVGLGLAGLFAVEALATADSDHRARVARPWLAFGLAILIASLITPHHLHGLLFPFELTSMSFALSVISEWHPPNFQKFELQEAWILGLLFVAWALRLKLPWTRLLLLAAVIHLSLAHTRHLTLLAIIAPVLLASSLRDALARQQPPPPNRIDQWMNRLQGRVHPALALGLAGAITALALIPARHNIEPPDAALPKEAMAFLQQHPQQGKVLNSYAAGGTLIFAGIPVFIDGRADLYKDAFIKEHYAAFHGEPGKLPALLEKHEISWTFIDYQSAAVQIIDLLPGWERVYSDKQIVIHRRRNG
jgi:hypothetical protein